MYGNGDPQTIPLIGFELYRIALYLKLYRSAVQERKEVENGSENSIVKLGRSESQRTTFQKLSPSLLQMLTRNSVPCRTAFSIYSGVIDQSQAVIKQHTLPSSISPNQLVRHQNGDLTGLSFDSMGTTRKVEIIYNSHGVKGRQTLLAVPAWEDVKNIAVGVRMPSQTREGKITLILNKTEQPIYNISLETPSVDPAIITKDIRAIYDHKSQVTKQVDLDGGAFQTVRMKSVENIKPRRYLHSATLDVECTMYV